MKKPDKILLTIVFISLLLCGIAVGAHLNKTIEENKLSAFKEADAIENPNRFRIESGGTLIGVALVTDRETGVQYLMNTRSGEMTLLVDKDGNPFITNGWRDYDGNG